MKYEPQEDFVVYFRAHGHITVRAGGGKEAKDRAHNKVKALMDKMKGVEWTEFDADEGVPI